MSDKTERLEAQLATTTSIQEKIDRLNQLAWELRYTDLGRAISLAEEAKKLASTGQFATISYQKGIAQALRNLGNFYLRRSNYEEAMVVSFKALAIFEKLEDYKEQAMVLTTVAICYTLLGNHPDALEHQLRALKISHRIADKEQEATSYTVIGLIYTHTNDWYKALNQYQKSLQIYQEINYEKGQCESLKSLTTVTQELELYDNALSYGLLGRKIARKIGDRQAEGEILNGLGEVYMKIDDSSQSLIYFQKGLAISKDIENKYEIMRSLLRMGQVYQQRQEVPIALWHLSEALKLAEEIDARQALFQCHELLALVHKEAGNFQEALNHYQLFHQIKEAIFNLKAEQKLKQLETLHRTQTAKKEREIFQMKNIELEKEVAERQRAEKALTEAHFALQRAHDLLEERVVERTAALSEANAALEEKVTENTRLLAEVQAHSQAMEDKNQALSQMDKLKDEFLANTSHELRTPLNGMIGIAEALLDGVAGPLPQTVAMNLGMIITSGRRLSSLINDILDFSKLKNNDLTLHVKPVYLHPLVEVVLAFSQSLINHKPLKLINTIDPDLPPVLGDENRLQQIMHNLVNNAIKFTEHGHITISASVAGEMARLHIIDTGIGIPSEQMKHLFIPFSEIDQMSISVREGIGLGLPITKSLIELHGGQIWIESTVGEGSTFTFELPLSRQKVDPGVKQLADNQLKTLTFTRHQIEKQNLEAPSPSSTQAEARILIVDDEPVNLQLLTNYLSLHNYDITQALNGIEALRKVEDNLEFDLVILDVIIPHLSGYEVCRQIREIYSPYELPIILMSTQSRIEDLTIGLQAGANDYLTKPIGKDKLLARVQTHLHLKHLFAENIQFNTHLQASEKKYRAIFEESKDGIYITDVDGKIQDINPAGLEIIGYTKVELPALNIEDIYVNLDDRRQFQKAIVTAGQVKDFELMYRRKDGEIIYCLETATLRKGEDGTVLGYQGFLRDITAQKEAEKERLRFLAIQRELTLAHQIQQNFLPPPRPDWPGIDIICYSTPAQEVGGDLYTYHNFNQTKVGPVHCAVAVGDVSGKGMPAALVMAVSLTSFRTAIGQHLSPSALLSHLDQVLASYTHAIKQNCAMVYTEIQQIVSTDKVDEDCPKRYKIQVANAGCIFPIVRYQTGEVMWLPVGGIPLGVGLGSELGYHHLELELMAGDMIVLTSDGTIELKEEGGEMFGFERFEEVVARAPTTTVEAMLTHLKTEIDQFADNASPQDDLTIMVVKL